MYSIAFVEDGRKGYSFEACLAQMTLESILFR